MKKQKKERRKAFFIKHSFMILVVFSFGWLGQSNENARLLGNGNHEQLQIEMMFNVKKKQFL